MRRSPLLLGLVPALPVLVALGACTEAPVSIGLVLKAPLGLLEDAKSITLSVADAKGTTCDLTTGQVTGMPSGSGVQTFELQTTGCPAGTWCKQIELEQSDALKLFAIEAKGEGGVTIGQGCVQRAVDQDPLAVPITLRRFNEPACCGDGTIQAGETCDSNAPAQMACGALPLGDACGGIVATGSCRCDCSSEEVLVSRNNPAPPLLKNDPRGSKRELAMSFAQGLHTVFVHEDKGIVDLHARVLSPDLEMIEDANVGLQLRMPVMCMGDPTAASSVPNKQQSPAMTTAGDRVAIVYASDEIYPNTSEIFISIQNQKGCTDAPVNMPLEPLTNLGNNSPASSTNPDVAAGPEGKLLVTWQREGNIFGRIVNPVTQLPEGDEFQISDEGGTNARVAGSAENWVVVYENASENIARRFILPGSSKTVELPVQVNLGDTNGKQDQPDIAMLPGGRFIIVWHDANGDEIRFQRVLDGANVPGDQDQPLNVPSPDTLQQRPVVAASLDRAFFAVAWVDVDGTISARYVDAEEGFRFNAVTGQNTPFLASRPDILNTVRTAPAIAIGPKHVAIGWQADGEMNYGIFVRRFPLPLDL